MYRLRVETTFDAAHNIIAIGGKCERLHGHTWKVELFVLGEKEETNIKDWFFFAALLTLLIQIYHRYGKGRILQ